MDLTFRPFTADDRPAGHALRVDAFSSSGHVDYEGERYIPDNRRIGAFAADGRLIGQAGAWDFGQWFLGRRLPMAGIAGVTVQPEARRQGLAARLLTALTHVCVDQGDVIATLDPSAPEVYRRQGYAFAGVWVTRTLPTALLQELPTPGEPPVIRPINWEADLPAIADLWRDQARRHHGWLDRSDTWTRRLLEPDEDFRTWVAERDGRLVGLVQVEKQSAPTGDRSVFEQVVSDLVAVDRDAWLALWRLVGSQASMCQSTILLSAPHEPLLDELSPAHHDQTQRMKSWMSRILNAPAAVAGRGWPDVTTVVPLSLTDPLLPANAGDWVLEITGGEGTLERATSQAVSRPVLDIGAFTALFTGHVAATTLAWQERLTGATQDQLTALDAAFRSPQPHLHDHF